MGRWLRHHPGGAGLRSEHLSSTGAMGPSVSWDPWPRPVARATVVTQECTQIGENGCVGAVLGHLCTLLRCESRRELRQVARVPQPPRRVGGAPSLAPLAWSGRQALNEWRRCSVAIFAEASTHTSPRRAPKCAFPYLGKRRTTSRKSTLCPVTLPTPDRRLTKRHALPVGMPRIRRRAIAPRFSAAVACRHSMACHA